MAFLYAYRRLVVVLWRFLPLLVSFARDRRRFLLFGGRRQLGQKAERKRAEQLLDILLSLGPTFVKLGQLLSTRPDVLPPVYVDVLSRLQDRVPPAPWSEAERVVREEVGAVEDAFDSFDTEPISGASLGQVYTAWYEGQKVAVKIRRPGVAKLVAADLTVVRWTLPIISMFVDDARSYSLSNLADEFDATIHEEMDYVREARMLREIRSNFSNNDRIAMPTVVDERSTDRVLTMEYIPGTKITNLQGLAAIDVNRTTLAKRLVRAYLKMLVEDGVFHADPHPGNLAVADDGTLVFYDFGMSGHVDPLVQESIVEFYLAAADGNVDTIIDMMQRMGALSTTVDRGLVEEVLELAIKDARGQEVDQYRVQRIVEEVEDTMYEFPFRLPRNLALVLRVATVVEGVCVTLDPDFDFVDAATEFLSDRGYREETVRQSVESAGERIRESAGAMVRVPPKLERTLDRLDRDNLRVEAIVVDQKGVVDRLGRRITYAILLAAVGLATAVVYATGQSQMIVMSLGIVGLILAAVLFRSLRERRRIGPQPQFTRQGLQDQQPASRTVEGEQATSHGQRTSPKPATSDTQRRDVGRLEADIDDEPRTQKPDGERENNS